MPGADAHPGLAAAERLRRLADVLSAADDDDATWAAAAVRRYLATPAQGSLDAAFGLTVRAGGSPWWRIRADAQRDALIRALGATLTGATNARATALQQMLRRYGTSAWVRDRVTGSPTAANATLFRIYSLDPDPPTGIRRLTEILSA